MYKIPWASHGFSPGRVNSDKTFIKTIPENKTIKTDFIQHMFGFEALLPEVKLLHSCVTHIPTAHKSTT